MKKEYLLKLNKEKENLFFELSNCKDEIEKDKIINKIQEIDLILYKYRNTLEETPVIKGTRVDLYKYLVNGEGIYAICLHDTNNIVGYIEYRGEITLHKDSVGNIGYETYRDYRRKGYMLEALNLLGKVLYGKGVDKFYISTNKNNIPSLKLIEKFGGKIMKKYSHSYCVYECNLALIKINGVKR